MTIVLNLLIEWIKVNDPIEELLFITTSDNLASQKVITNIGSNFVDQIFDRQHNRTVYRYKYSLTKKLKK
jgi:predicted acetyltransferase